MKLFRPGEGLNAQDINDIVDGLITRISGGKGIRVRAFGDGLIVERDIPRKAAQEEQVPIALTGSISGYTMCTFKDLLIFSGNPLGIFRYDGTTFTDDDAATTVGRFFIELGGELWAVGGLSTGGCHLRISDGVWQSKTTGGLRLGVHDGTYFWSIRNHYSGTKFYPGYSSNGIGWSNTTLLDGPWGNAWIAFGLGEVVVVNSSADSMHKCYTSGAIAVVGHPSPVYRVFALGSYLFCSTTDGKLYRTSDLSSWTLVFTGDANIQTMYHDGTRYYLGLYYKADLYRSTTSDAGTWAYKGTIVPITARIECMARYQGSLHVGHRNGICWCPPSW